MVLGSALGAGDRRDHSSAVDVWDLCPDPVPRIPSRAHREYGKTWASVITTGPYGIIPPSGLASGTILFFVGTTLLLGAWWGLAATLVLVVLLGIRIRFEENALRNGLRRLRRLVARIPVID